MKEWMEPIDSELPLAKAFNRIISDLELLRIMTNPRIFSDSTDKEAPFRMHNYYLTVLWERWLHGVFNRLVEWANTISSYFDEYNGSWEYYALSQRLEFIKEYGSDDEDDYNPASPPRQNQILPIIKTKIYKDTRNALFKFKKSQAYSSASHCIFTNCRINSCTHTSGGISGQRWATLTS